jgi:hypothetical protein
LLLPLEFARRALENKPHMSKLRERLRWSNKTRSYKDLLVQQEPLVLEKFELPKERMQTEKKLAQNKDVFSGMKYSMGGIRRGDVHG